MKRGVHTGSGWGDLRKGDHLEDLVIDGRILKWTSRSGEDYISRNFMIRKTQDILFV
jgi:hypothetical protein